MANPSPLEHLVDLTIHERHLIELNPNRKVATKGGSMPGIFQMQNEQGYLRLERISPPDQVEFLKGA